MKETRETREKYGSETAYRKTINDTQTCSVMLGDISG
jgi:hypothetical protein